MHDHGLALSEDAYEPLADACSFYLMDLPCGCQDVAYACRYVDHEHDHVVCSDKSAKEGEASMDEQNTLARGDVYLWQNSVRAEITRVARDGSWVDLRCTTFLNPNAWSKRQRLPFPESFVKMEPDAHMELMPNAHLAE